MTTTEKKQFEEDGHLYRPWEGAGLLKPRMRCVHCKVFHDERPLPCKGPQPQRNPAGKVLDTCPELEEPLGNAIRALIAGYQDQPTEEKTDAYMAGRRAAGLAVPESGTIDQLQFLVEGEPVGLQYDPKSTKFTVSRGHIAVARDTLEEAIDHMHAESRPPCPRCGSNKYVKCYGTFRHKFQPSSCDQCGEK